MDIHELATNIHDLIIHARSQWDHTCTDAGVGGLDLRQRAVKTACARTHKYLATE